MMPWTIENNQTMHTSYSIKKMVNMLSQYDNYLSYCENLDKSGRKIKIIANAPPNKTYFITVLQNAGFTQNPSMDLPKITNQRGKDMCRKVMGSI